MNERVQYEIAAEMDEPELLPGILEATNCLRQNIESLGTRFLTQHGSFEMFERITRGPAVLSRKPIIKGTRISVEMILEWPGSGASREDIVRQYPHLTSADIEQAISFAASSFRNDVVLTAEVKS